MCSIGGRKNMRDDDRSRGWHRRRDFHSEQVAQDSIADKIDVRPSLAEVVLFYCVEYRLDLFDGFSQRPFGVDLLLANALPRRIEQVLVAQDQLMGFEDQKV